MISNPEKQKKIPMRSSVEVLPPLPTSQSLKSSWLVVEPTHVKNMLVKMGSSSPNRGQNKKIFELPPPGKVLVGIPEAKNLFQPSSWLISQHPGGPGGPGWGLLIQS